jgi:hypothetical protein
MQACSSLFNGSVESVHRLAVLFFLLDMSIAAACTLLAIVFV